jgi:hypothetical protein
MSVACTKVYVLLICLGSEAGLRRGSERVFDGSLALRASPVLTFPGLGHGASNARPRVSSENAWYGLSDFHAILRDYINTHFLASFSSGFSVLGRFSLELDDSIDALLRGYIKENYLRSHGKITNIIENAITAYCSNNGVVESVQNLGLGKHVVLLGEDRELARKILLSFLGSGISRGYHSLYLAPKEDGTTASDLVKEMVERSVPVSAPAALRLLHVVEVPVKSGVQPKAVVEEVLARLKEVPPPYYAVSAAPLEDAESLAFEDYFQRMPKPFKVSLLCDRPLTEEKKGSIGWLSRLTASHDAVVLAMGNRCATVGLG